MTVSPYLENLLYKWGSCVRKIKPWHSECPYLKQYLGTTTRSPTFTDADDDVEKIGLLIGELAMPLRRSLEAKYKHRLKTDKAKANWCRTTKSEYSSNLRHAIQKLQAILLNGK